MLKEKYKGYSYSKILENATDEQIRILGVIPFFYHPDKPGEEGKKEKLIIEFVKDYPPYYSVVSRDNEVYSSKEKANKIIDRGIYKAVFREYNPENSNPMNINDFIQSLKDTIPTRYKELIKKNNLSRVLLNT